MKFVAVLQKASSLVFVLGLAFIGLLGFLDYLTGDFSLDPFYLAVIFVVTWFVGSLYGMICVFEAVVAEAVSDYYVHAGEVFTSFYYWNWATDLIVFSAFCFLVAVIRRLMADKS